MTIFKFSPLGLVVALAACSGTNADDLPLRDVATDGFFDNVSLPNSANGAALPIEVGETVSEFIIANERDNPTTIANMPTAGATYDGDYAIEIADTAGVTKTILDGDLEMTIDFANNRIVGRFEDIDAYDANNAIILAEGTVGIAASISDNTFAGTFDSDIKLDGATVNLDGSLNGIFAGAKGDDTVGLITGDATNADGSVDQMTGVFTADKE